MQHEQILELIKEVSKAGLSNFEYVEGNLRIAMSCQEPVYTTGMPVMTPPPVMEVQGNPRIAVSGKNMSADVSSAAAEKTEAVAKSSEEKAGELVKSPLVGTFYAAPSEDADDFVKVGDTVKKGQVLAIVEAMKLMNEIESELDGVVTEILVGNEEAVEYGQPLFRIG